MNNTIDKNLKVEIKERHGEFIKLTAKINSSVFSDSMKNDFLTRAINSYNKYLDTLFESMFKMMDMNSELKMQLESTKQEMDWIYYDRNVASYLLLGHLAERLNADPKDIEAFNRAKYPEIPKHKRSQT